METEKLLADLCSNRTSQLTQLSSIKQLSTLPTGNPLLSLVQYEAAGKAMEGNAPEENHPGELIDDAEE